MYIIIAVYSSAKSIFTKNFSRLYFVSPLLILWEVSQSWIFKSFSNDNATATATDTTTATATANKTWIFKSLSRNT